MKHRATLVVFAVIAAIVHPATAIEVTPETVAEWNRYIAAAAAHLHERDADDFLAEPHGRVIDIPRGAIHHWKGSTLVRRTTVDTVVKALMYPGTPPPQDDVLESRVLGREGNTLRVYLKLARSAIVTVVYDTEHDVTFERYASGLAVSRSVSTKIAETGGGDRGFLWRLNSYWRYTQVGNDVRVELESISLSRDVPWFAQPLAGRLIGRIGRESITRTLNSVRCFLENSESGICSLPARRAAPGPPTRTPACWGGDASPVIMFVAALAGAPGARTVRAGVAAGAETPRQDPQSVDSIGRRISPRSYITPA